MEKKTIGSFIAVLRKSNGLTQQEVADKLNVSNKTVSKWERDESYPDIALIPAIAELFGTTCDEILLGERIIKSEMPSTKANRADKQLKWLADSIETKFKNIFYISLLITIVGIVLLYSISYAFYLPVLGFGINLITIISSIIISVIQVNKSNLMLNSEEFTEENKDIFKLQRVNIYKYFFIILSVNTVAFTLSLPFIFARDNVFTNSVIDLESYSLLLPYMVLLTVAIIACIYYALRNKLILKQYNGYSFSKIKNIRLIYFLQCIFILATFIIPTSEILGLNSSNTNLYILNAIFFAPLIFLLIIIIFFSIKAEDKTARLYILSLGIRNILYTLAVVMLFSSQSITYYSSGSSEITQIMNEAESSISSVAYPVSEETYNSLYIFGGLIIIILATIAYWVFKNKLNKKASL